MLTGWSKLAKTSVQPGKTRTINHFLINESWYLVDLPGYGYAKVSFSEKQRWSKLVEGYFNFSKNIFNIKINQYLNINTEFFNVINTIKKIFA